MKQNICKYMVNPASVPPLRDREREHSSCDMLVSVKQGDVYGSIP